MKILLRGANDVEAANWLLGQMEDSDYDVRVEGTVLSVPPQAVGDVIYRLENYAASEVACRRLPKRTLTITRALAERVRDAAGIYGLPDEEL